MRQLSWFLCVLLAGCFPSGVFLTDDDDSPGDDDDSPGDDDAADDDAADDDAADDDAADDDAADDDDASPWAGAWEGRLVLVRFGDGGKIPICEDAAFGSIDEGGAVEAFGGCTSQAGNRFEVAAVGFLDREGQFEGESTVQAVTLGSTGKWPARGGIEPGEVEQFVLAWDGTIVRPDGQEIAYSGRIVLER